MQAFLDDASLPLERPTFAAAIAAGARAARARGRTVSQVWLDGAPVGAAIIQNPPEAALGREVRMVSAGEGPAAGLEGARASLERAAAAQSLAAELIQTARLDEALKPLADAIESWQRVQAEVSRELAWAAGLEAFNAMLGALSDTLREVQRSLRDQDWSGLSDVLAFDMKEQAAGWRELIDGVSAGASGEGPGE